MKLMYNWPMGPFELLDLIGIDVAVMVGESIYSELKDPIYVPPPLLKQMVRAGLLGRKTGKGFYQY
jgi:3-hydroxybutyryl-CoA dehydrogenase